jgi:5-methylcytosine-specific restriction endonuclease McrA
VLPFVFKVREKEYEGHNVRMTSLRYKLFATKGCVCIKCGLVGWYFSLEKHGNDTTGKFHFNLYGVKDGKPVMMTKDHIVPKSKGGSDRLENLQPMCVDCNSKKADKNIILTL